MHLFNGHSLREGCATAMLRFDSDPQLARLAFFHGNRHVSVASFAK
jgi:hypothetical protein